jgi:hypothetical protein
MPGRQHPRGCMICRLVRAVLLALLTLITMQDQRSGAQDHERPYFMPSVERDRLHGLILKEAWAKADHARLKRAASTGDGFALHFFTPSMATPGMPPSLNNGCWGNMARARIGPCALASGSWAHNKARKEIEEGIVLWSRYKMRAMDRSTQRANLVFKPTSAVALAGPDSETLTMLSIFQQGHKRRWAGAGSPSN